MSIFLCSIQDELAKKSYHLSINSDKEFIDCLARETVLELDGKMAQIKKKTKSQKEVAVSFAAAARLASAISAANARAKAKLPVPFPRESTPVELDTSVVPPATPPPLDITSCPPFTPTKDERDDKEPEKATLSKEVTEKKADQEEQKTENESNDSDDDDEDGENEEGKEPDGQIGSELKRKSSSDSQNAKKVKLCSLPPFTQDL